jgi:hypothetical protein
MTSLMRVQPAAILALALAVGACQRAPDQGQGGPSPDSSIPEHYRFLSQFGVSLDDVDSIWARLPYDSIALRRDPCFGACPWYDATFYRGGKARYHGTRFVEREGDFQGEITLQDYGRLSYLLDRLGFMSLADSFSIRATDLPGAALTVSRRPGGVKSVYDYGYVGPVELWTLMEVFDGIASRVQWQPIQP